MDTHIRALTTSYGVQTITFAAAVLLCGVEVKRQVFD